MASRLVPDRIPLKMLQRYHQSVINTFGEHETLVDAVSIRPGFFGPSPVAFLSLVARRPSIRSKDLDEAILNDRSLIRASGFRGSLFLMSTADYPVYYRALYPLLKNIGVQLLSSHGISEKIMEFFAEKIKNLDSIIPLSHHEIINTLFPSPKKRPPPSC